MITKDGINTWSDDDTLVCPYCGHRYSIDHTESFAGCADEMEFDGVPFTCPECERDYAVNRSVCFTYETFPMDAGVRVRFYRDGGRWFADMPGHTREENEMVMGADTLLESLSCGRGEITLSLSTEEPGAYLLHLSRTGHDTDGATYSVTGSEYNRLMEAMAEGAVAPFSEIWLCGVVHDAFGEHPEDIYVTAVE